MTHANESNVLEICKFRKAGNVINLWRRNLSFCLFLGDTFISINKECLLKIYLENTLHIMIA